MKKIITTLLFVFTMSLTLVGCGEKTIHVEISGIDNFDIVSVPEGTVKSWNNDEDLYFTVNKDGDYSYVLKDSEGIEHTVTIKYHNGKAEPEVEEGISINLGIE